jgi:CRISPR/Cas system CSM-associated protein Csm3 (group 7 of RAMP superfamily)
MIPAKAVRGVLRSRSEMILRTLGHPIPEPSEVKAVGNLTEAGRLDLASKIFGASGWRAPLETSAFTWADSGQPHWLRQEFVAIDRFTGGAADSKKFNAHSVVGAKLKGTVTLDLDRLKLCGTDAYAAGLLALVLRDLAEGDLCFGSGSAKGYGNCTVESATITIKNGNSLQNEAAPDGGTRAVASETLPSLQDWFISRIVQDSLAALRALQPATITTPQGTSHAS